MQKMFPKCVVRYHKSSSEDSYDKSPIWDKHWRSQRGGSTMAPPYLRPLLQPHPPPPPQHPKRLARGLLSKTTVGIGGGCFNVA